MMNQQVKVSWKYILITGLIPFLGCGRINSEENIVIPKIESEEKSEINLTSRNNNEIVIH